MNIPTASSCRRVGAEVGAGTEPSEGGIVSSLAREEDPVYKSFN